MKKASIKRKIRKFFSPFRRIGLKNNDFTIISNNCFAGILYKDLGIEYKSPTVTLGKKPYQILPRFSGSATL